MKPKILPATDERYMVVNPPLQQIQGAVEWLSSECSTNQELEFVLNLVLNGQINLEQTGDRLVLLHSSPKQHQLTSSIRGVMVAKPNNQTVNLECCDRLAAELLFNQIQLQGCPQRVSTSLQVKDWIRPLILQHYQLERESDQPVMLCTQAPPGGEGRWATLEDKPALQAYAEGYWAERGSGSTTQNWDAMIQQHRIAVLEHNNEVASVIKWGHMGQSALIIGTYTFPKFRRQGHAYRLLAFLIQELLKTYTAAKLWVNEDNAAAIALYRSLGFHAIGASYTGYFKHLE